MTEPGRKRRQILVDAELQVGLAMHILGWLYFYVVAFAFLANAESIWSVLTDDAADATYSEAVKRLQWFTQFTVIPLAITFVCVAAHAVVLTHRVAGPIYRIKATLAEMAQRRLPSRPVRLRDKDYFKDVATALDAVITTQRDDAQRQQRMNAETMAATRALVEALERGGRPPQELVAMAHVVLDGAERLDRHLAAVDAPGSAEPAGEGAAERPAPAGLPATA